MQAHTKFLTGVIGEESKQLSGADGRVVKQHIIENSFMIEVVGIIAS